MKSAEKKFPEDILNILKFVIDMSNWALCRTIQEVTLLVISNWSHGFHWPNIEISLPWIDSSTYKLL